MINVLLRHDHRVRNIASTIVIHRYQNNDKDAFYLFFDPLTASVIEPRINLPRHSQKAARRGRRTTEKKKNMCGTAHTSHIAPLTIFHHRGLLFWSCCLDTCPETSLIFLQRRSRSVRAAADSHRGILLSENWHECQQLERLPRSVPFQAVRAQAHPRASRQRGLQGGLHIPKLGQHPLECTLPTLPGRNRYNDTRENIRSDAFPQLQRHLQPTSGRKHLHCAPVWNLCFLTLKTVKIITVGRAGLKIKPAPCTWKMF